MAEIRAFAVALFFCAEITGLSVGAEQVDAIKTKDAFLSVYRPFAMAFQDMPDFYCRTHFEESGVSIKSTEAIIDIYKRDQATRLDFLPLNESVDTPARVRVVSPDKSFKLKRQGADNPFFITELSGEALLNNYRQFEQDMRLVYPIVSPWNGFLETTVESYVSRPDVKLQKIERLQIVPAVLEVSFRRQFTAEDGTPIDQRVRFRFLMDKGWALSEYQAGSESNYMLAQIKYAEGNQWPPTPVALVKRQVSGMSDIIKESYSIDEFALERQSTKLFRLSAFGLNDGIGRRGWMSTAWLIAFNIVFLLALVAIYFYRRTHGV